MLQGVGRAHLDVVDLIEAGPRQLLEPRCLDQLPSVASRQGSRRCLQETVEGRGYLPLVWGEVDVAGGESEAIDLSLERDDLIVVTPEGDRFAAWLDSVSDDFLGEKVTMPAGMNPPSKTRFEMILGVKEHEMHHRGQLMLIERLIGQVPHLTREMNAWIEATMAGSKR